MLNDSAVTTTLGKLFHRLVTRLQNEYFLKPNTHRRRRRDEIVESRRVGGVYTNSQLVGNSFVVSSVWTHPSAVVTHTAALCVRIAESVGSRREFMYTPTTPTRRDSTVSARRRRRCVLGLYCCMNATTLTNDINSEIFYSCINLMCCGTVVIVTGKV